MRMKIFYPTLFFIILLTMELAISSYGKNSSLGCFPRERKALLKFKASLADPSDRLSSWDESYDCCAWEGVKCDKTMGRVIELDLRNRKIYEYDDNKFLYGDRIDSSLSELKYLSYLDLSYNDFNYSPIPAFIGSMKQLQYLNLSSTRLVGIVPHNLGNLSRLQTLDLNRAGVLIVDDLMWVSNLTLLENLHLNGVDLSRTKSLLKVLNMLPSLSVLSLSSSGLDKTNLAHACVNFTNHIKYLDLSGNSFEGEFPCFLQNMTSLRVLDLSNNRYNTSIPHHLRLRNLVDISLDGNLLYNINWISEFLWDKCQLKSLNLEANQFYGEILELFKNSSSGCWIDKLEKLSLGINEFYGNLPEEVGDLKQLNYLDLSNNKFRGPIPWSFGKLLSLTELHISHNRLSGSIPSSLGNMRSLRILDMYSNQLSGEIPTSLGQLSNLEIIDFSSNSFSGTLSEAHFAKLSKIESITAGKFKFQVSLDWVPPFQLKTLYLKSCEVGGRFPQWLQTQRSLTVLSLSNCSISGKLPNWLQYINLSHNHIEGPIKYLVSNITHLDVSNNMINHLPRNIGYMMPLLLIFVLAQNSINGSIPNSLCEMKALHILDLSNNYLSGNIPDCWENFSNLKNMMFSSNELSGIIPKTIGGAYSLEWLQLNNNSITGQLPSSLKNCTMLHVLDVGGNKLSGNLPHWIANYLSFLQFLILRNNEFYGVIPSQFCQLFNLQVMDLADNKLVGKIPHCIGNLSNMVIPYDYKEGYFGSLEQVLDGVIKEFSNTLTYLTNFDLSNNNLIGEIPLELTNLRALIGLNLSHNHLEGNIPAKIGDLKSLLSLDLSSNQLFGTIPDSLSGLNFLNHLNLSHNNLSGQIPTGNQLQTLDDPSIYDGNPELCGAPLPKKCRNNKARKAPKVENHVAADEGDLAENIYLYGSIISGFATGFWGIFGILVFKRSWSHAYFRFTDVVFRKILGS